jgi:hypothetical protein
MSPGCWETSARDQTQMIWHIFQRMCSELRNTQAISREESWRLIEFGVPHPKLAQHPKRIRRYQNLLARYLYLCKLAIQRTCVKDCSLSHDMLQTRAFGMYAGLSSLLDFFRSFRQMPPLHSPSGDLLGLIQNYRVVRLTLGIADLLLRAIF